MQTILIIPETPPPKKIQKLAGLYQLLLIIQIPWEQIHINFTIKLPEDDGY